VLPSYTSGSNRSLDNSDSMTEEDRTQSLQDTLGRVATLATTLSPDGISVRTLHGEDMDGQWDNLQTVEDIKKRMDKVAWGGLTPLGTILSRKVLKPMVLDKARHGSLKRPVIVVIITDGEESCGLNTYVYSFS
jgi:Mg-chelatase subunit ChlD